MARADYTQTGASSGRNDPGRYPSFGERNKYSDYEDRRSSSYGCFGVPF